MTRRSIFRRLLAVALAPLLKWWPAPPRRPHWYNWTARYSGTMDNDEAVRRIKEAMQTTHFTPPIIYGGPERMFEFTPPPEGFNGGNPRGFSLAAQRDMEGDA